MSEDDEDFPFIVSKGRRTTKAISEPSKSQVEPIPQDSSSQPAEQQNEILPTVPTEMDASMDMIDSPPFPQTDDDDDAPLLGQTAADDDDTAFLVSHDDSEDEEPASTRSRRAKRRRRESSSEEESSNASDAEGQVVSSSRDRDRRTKLIGQVLARWWHVLPEWPPEDFDYSAELAKRKLKQVSFDDWELEDDVDANGVTKVYQITHFAGMFRNPAGEVIDLRPAEGKPCFRNLSKYSDIELYQMLITALKNQIRELEESPYLVTDASVVARLRDDLNRETRLAMQTLTRLEKA